jgi:3-hydroxybutyryl-CoA dehydratase
LDGGLWTQSELDAARHIYKQAGFRVVEQKWHPSFSKDLVAETWELSLYHDFRTPKVHTLRMSYIRDKAIAGLKPGDSFCASRAFTEQDMTAFADISRDYNPVHFDDRFANAKNFRGRINHGLLVASLVTELGGQIGWLASGMNFRFKKPVYFGDTIECSLTITEIDDRNRAKAEAVFKNQQNEVVIEAHLTGIVPGLPERQVMEAMTAEGDPTNKSR